MLLRSWMLWLSYATYEETQALRKKGMELKEKPISSEGDSKYDRQGFFGYCGDPHLHGLSVRQKIVFDIQTNFFGCMSGCGCSVNNGVQWTTGYADDHPSPQKQADHVFLMVCIIIVAA